VGKPEGKRPIRRPRCRWVDDIKLDLRERGWGGMDWIDLAQDRDQWRALVNTVMSIRFPYNDRKFLSSCKVGGFSRRLTCNLATASKDGNQARTSDDVTR
jgi:hypothetical protein